MADVDLHAAVVLGRDQAIGPRAVRGRMGGVRAGIGQGWVCLAAWPPCSCCIHTLQASLNLLVQACPCATSVYCLLSLLPPLRACSLAPSPHRCCWLLLPPAHHLRGMYRSTISPSSLRMVAGFCIEALGNNQWDQQSTSCVLACGSRRAARLLSHGSSDPYTPLMSAGAQERCAWSCGASGAWPTHHAAAEAQRCGRRPIRAHLEYTPRSKLRQERARQAACGDLGVLVPCILQHIL